MFTLYPSLEKLLTTAKIVPAVNQVEYVVLSCILRRHFHDVTSTDVHLGFILISPSPN